MGTDVERRQPHEGSNRDQGDLPPNQRMLPESGSSKDGASPQAFREAQPGYHLDF